MSEWHDIIEDIRKLRDKVDKPGIDLPALQNALYKTLLILGTMAIRMELQREPPYQASLTILKGASPAVQGREHVSDLRIQTLTSRVELNETAQNHRLGLTEQQIKKDRDAILEKLDAILQRLPEPPRGFDE